MAIVYSTELASKLLAAIVTVDENTPSAGSFYAEPYQNGREHGWALSAGDRKVAFANDRHTSDLVVYSGHVRDFAPAGNLPSERVYKQRRGFQDNPDSIWQAAQMIVAYLIEAHSPDMEHTP